MTAPGEPPAIPPRIPLIDATRGVALVGMFVFHLTWDLGYFRLIPEWFPYSPGFMLFGHAVAITFLALAGASLVLAARGGMDWRAYGRRLLTIVAAAGAITLGTLYLFPESFIFFGILHCIAAASILATLFLRAPPWAALLAAAAMAVAPVWFASAGWDNLAGWSLGLSAHEPRSNDWRPLLPWAAATIAGVGLMRLALARGLPATIAGWRATGGAGRLLCWGGRHSLLVYLVHQPVFFGMVALAAMAVGGNNPPSPSEELQFLESCEATCGTASVGAETCRSVCACVGERIRDAGLWRPAMEGRMTPDQGALVEAFSRQCACPAPRGAGQR